MQYNTIRQYQEGGATKRALGQAFIGSGVMEAQEELEEEAKKAEKEGFFRKIAGTLGSFAGTYALPALATAVLGPVGLVGGALLKGAGAGLGRGLGETLGGIGAEDVSESSTGFLAKDFSTLKDYQKSLGEGIGERALGQAGSTALTDFVLSGGFKALGDIKESKQAASVGDPTLKKAMAFDIEKPELGLQRSLGEKNFLTSGPLTESKVSLSDTIPSDFSTGRMALESSKDILSDARNIIEAPSPTTFGPINPDLLENVKSSVSSMINRPSESPMTDEIILGGSSGLDVSDEKLLDMLWRTIGQSPEIGTGFNRGQYLKELRGYMGGGLSRGLINPNNYGRRIV